MINRILARIKMDIIQMYESLDYDSGDYDIDMQNEAKREAYSEVLSVIENRLIGIEEER